MRNKLFFVTAAVCLSLGFNTGSTIASEHTLSELYSLAKAKDPVIGKAEARLEAGKADQEIAWAGLFPKVSASASQRKFWHTVENYSTSTIDGAYEGHAYSVTGQLPVFTMPSYFQISAAEAGVNSAEAGTDLAQQDLIIRLSDNYIKLLKAQADEKLYRDEMTRVAKILEQTEAFLKAGTGDVIAVYEAKARLDSAAADLVKAEGQRRVAEQALSSLTGITVSSVKDIQVTSPQRPKPAELDWWLETMRKKHPSLRQAKEDLNQAMHYSNANRAAHLPVIQLSGGYTVDKGSTFLPEVETKQWYIGASVSLPIYSGGETVARTRKAVASESERRFMFEDAKDQNTKRLKEAFLNLEYNVSLAEAYKRKFDSAELQLQATKKGRDIGTRTAIDLLNAEQTFAISRRDLNNALYDNLQRQLELKSAAGLVTADDIKQIR